ncbi:MAG TPA: TauD/TfdA family dioxygenase [Vicinamibacterales bacterium]|nr:TauD/TfdA family dioxygenase [Vicinamibacterales bacterium]
MAEWGTRGDMRMLSSLTVIASGSVLGAKVVGVNLRELDERLFLAIHEAWLEHQVLVFPDQCLLDEDLIAFSRRFGPLDHAPVQENGQRFVKGHPEIYVVSNVIENGVAIGSLGSGEAVWHTDMSYLVDPPKASVLYALEVPVTGGETGFCSMYSAWEALPERLQRYVAGFKVKHDGTYNSGGYVRADATPTDDPRTAPGAFHPLVGIHPQSGRRFLYLGRRRNAYIEGLPLDQSEALLNEIWSYATDDSLTWYHHWSVGDLVIWDNRCTMHRRNAFDSKSRRVMHRTQIKGR